MSSPLHSPTGNWWNIGVSRHEKLWISISIVWALLLFGWMIAWGSVGKQNPMGPTYQVTAEEFMGKMDAYQEASEETDRGLRPDGEDIYIASSRFTFVGLPVILEAGKQYQMHLTSYDVQHGFSIRPEDALSKQMSLQILPGYEWVLPMKFDEPGVYHVVCNEFCGVGHRTMHGTFIVEEPNE